MITIFGRFVAVLGVTSEKSVGGLRFCRFRIENDGIPQIESLADSASHVVFTKLFLNFMTSIVIEGLAT